MDISLVTVKRNGMPINFIYFIKIGETVYDLKIKIELTDLMNREDQLLLLGPNPLIQDHRFLSYYGVVNKSIIDLHKKHKDTTFEVTVVIAENQLPVAIFPDMSSNESISKLKVAIENRIGVFRGRQLLLFQNVELYNSDLLRDFSATLHPRVTLATNPPYQEEMFNVRVVEGKTGCLIREVSLHPLDSVGLLYSTLQRWEAALTRRGFKLFYGSIFILGTESVKELDVRHDSVVSLILEDGMS